RVITGGADKRMTGHILEYSQIGIETGLPRRQILRVGSFRIGEIAAGVIGDEGGTQRGGVAITPDSVRIAVQVEINSDVSDLRSGGNTQHAANQQAQEAKNLAYPIVA